MLSEIQQRFIDALLGKNHANDNHQALKVYRSNYFAGLSQALEEIYPVCKKLVGDSFFRFLTEEYIKKYPSISFSLNEYGSNFSNFISTVEQCKKLPYLSDIAKLELIIHKSKFGYNAKKFPYDRFAQVNAELFNKVKFYLISNSFVFTSKYPIDKIWEYNQKASDEVLEIDIKRIYLFIYNNNLKQHICRISNEEYLLLQELKKEQEFEAVCQNLLDKVRSESIIEMLPKFLQLGYIDSFSY